MLTQQRKTHILDVLRQTGQVVAKAISQELGLSEDTIRRDLRELAAEGLLQRVHGGALPASPALADYAGRRMVQREGKAAIGRLAARMIQPGQIVFVDGGTTALQLVRHLPPNLQATIVTHSPTIAVELIGHATITVELIGGRLFKHSAVAVGALAIEAISRIRADTYFMGVTGVHAEGGLTTGDREEAAVKGALCRQAAETVVLGSREKLGAVSPYKVIDAAEMDILVVEPSSPDHDLAPFRALGVTVSVAAA